MSWSKQETILITGEFLIKSVSINSSIKSVVATQKIIKDIKEKTENSLIKFFHNQSVFYGCCTYRGRPDNVISM